MFSRVFFSFLLLAAASSRGEDFQGSTHKLEYDETPVGYSKATPSGHIAQLQARINSGEVRLKWDSEKGYLPALLHALNIPSSSQLLVFSKTSLQRSLINPKTPRALFYNDDLYVGYIPGADLLEISEADPKLGGVFYHLEQVAAFKPKLVRNNECLQCHGGNRSLGVPGHVIRSIGTSPEGEIDPQTEVAEMTHCSPLSERWGGWYVTGEHGWQTHRGNLVGIDALERQSREPNFLGNLKDLSALVDLREYPEPTSDIVSHLVLEHQSHMHNYVTRLNFETQQMLATYGHIRYLDRQVQSFLRYLLFVEEAPLTEPVRGRADFLSAFAADARRDTKGRSLRDFDLQHRLFKYPCSYLIYSAGFEQLPAPMKERIYRELGEILDGKNPQPEFARLSPEDRRAVKEILLATKKDLPASWKTAASEGSTETALR
jgi:hypothetical protein